MIRLTCLALLLTAFGSTTFAQSILDIPNPIEKKEWVVDQTDSVPQKDIERINRFCENIYSTGGTECVVVIIPTTGKQTIEAFANDLFNHWGIGKGSSDDGILLLVAKTDRRVRIHLGAGIDSPEQEAIAKAIIDNEITPRFKAGDFGEGLYAGTFSAALQILSLAEQEVVADLGQPKPNPVMNNLNNRSQQTSRPSNRAPQKTPIWPFVLGGGLLLGGIAFVGGRHWLRYRQRNCHRCDQEMVLLTEEQEDAFLEQPEITEERIGSVDYDVWACLSCEDVIKLRYGRFFTRYSICPSCSYKTKYEIKDTIVQANYNHGGRVRVDEYCENCPHRSTRYYSTPKLTKSKSSSGSGFGGGGGGRSFGGGRSSGGGASGSW